MRRENALDVGVHVFELILEDYAVSNITVTDVSGVSSVNNAVSDSSNPTALSQVPLQFAVESE